MEIFAGSSDGEKVQNVRFLNSESNSGAFRSGNRQFPTGHFHLQGHKRRQGQRDNNIIDSSPLDLRWRQFNLSFFSRAFFPTPRRSQKSRLRSTYCAKCFRECFNQQINGKSFPQVSPIWRILSGGPVQIREEGINPLADLVPRGPNTLADLYRGV